MRKLALLALLWPSLALAQLSTPTISTGVLIGSTGSTNVSNSATNYFALSGVTGTATALTAGSTVVMVTEDYIPGPGISLTFSNLFCFSGAAPGVGKSYALTIGGIGSGTFTCTIADTATSCSDTTHTQTTSGFGTSNVGFKVVPAGTPTATTIGCYMEMALN